MENLAVNFFMNKKRLYILDGYLGWDPKYRIKVRIVCTRAYHNLFMRNMIITPTPEE